MLQQRCANEEACIGTMGTELNNSRPCQNVIVGSNLLVFRNGASVPHERERCPGGATLEQGSSEGAMLVQKLTVGVNQLT